MVHCSAATPNISLQSADANAVLLFVVRPYKDQTALDIASSEEMKQLLTSPVKEAEPLTNGDSANQHSNSGIHL